MTLDTNSLIQNLQRMLDAEPTKGEAEAKQKLLMQTALGLVGNLFNDLRRSADALEEMAANDTARISGGK